MMEKSEFATHCLSIYPSAIPMKSEDCMQIEINGNPFNLEDLYRTVQLAPDRADEIVKKQFEYQSRMGHEERIEALKSGIHSKIMPILKPISYCSKNNSIVKTDFVNDTVIVATIDLPSGIALDIKEILEQANISEEDAIELAKQNLESIEDSKDNYTLVDSYEGGRACVFTYHDAYDASRLLLPSLHKQLAPELGQEFYAATPCRDALLCFSIEPVSFMHRMAWRIRQDFKRMPYPITDELFVVTRDGIAGGGGIEL